MTASAVMALLLGGCGGGGADPQANNPCTLTNPSGCGGSVSADTGTGGSGSTTTPTTPTPTPDPALRAASVSLLFSGNELKSAGVAGSEVAITAQVTDAANAALAGATVAFSADSGILTAAEAVTDKTGLARVLLGAGASSANRRIKVGVTVGAKSASGTVDVTGTSITVSGPSVISLGQSGDLTVSLRDSADRAISGARVTFQSANGNALTLKSATTEGAALTDAQGKIVLSLQASRIGADSVSVAALGAGAGKAISVESTDLRVTPAVTVDAGGAEALKEVATGACQPVDVRFEKQGVGQAGIVNLSTSRGKLYADGGCSLPLAGALTLAGGDAPRSYVASNNTGIATLTAAVANGPTSSTRIEFIAPLTPMSTLSLLADPAVLASNSGGQAAHATLTAVVRDGGVYNNLVKGATIVYSILSDPSGGYLMQPSSELTGSDGTAHAVYVAGAADSGKDGAVIEARIQGATTARGSALARLTVNKHALSIQFGTGNTATEYSPTLLQKEFSVLVSDGAGNAVPGVGVTASAWPTRYRKGHFEWIPDDIALPDKGFWYPAAPIETCLNEDKLRNGVYDAVYDFNGNGVLDPGIPITVGVSGPSDALGLTKVTLNYPRDRGYWVQVELTVRGSVGGTESSASTVFWLPTLSKDFNVRHISPPGQPSPYGEADTVIPPSAGAPQCSFF